MKWLKIIIITGVILFALFRLYTFITLKKAGDKAPLFEETLINGESFQLKNQTGKYTLLSFWGSWCAPCLKENPNLVQLYKKYENKDFKTASGFDIVSIAIEKNDKRTKELIKKHNLYWPYHIIKVSSLVMKEPLALLYSVTDLPTKILIDPDGVIVGRMKIREVDAYLFDK